MAKRTNNDLQNITHKTKDRETGTPLKTGNELHMWSPSCYTFDKPDDKNKMRKGPDYDYDNWNISVLICSSDIQARTT
jgi:hypothetical protein